MKKIPKEKPKPRWGWEMVYSIPPEKRFPPERSQEIASKLGFPANEVLSKEAAEATERYIASLETIDNRPSHAEKREALKILSKHAKEFSECLWKLDDSSRIELLKIALDLDYLEKAEEYARTIGGVSEVAVSKLSPPPLDSNLPSTAKIKTVKKKSFTKFDPKMGHSIFWRVNITREDGSKEKYEMTEGDFHAWQKIRNQSPAQKGRPRHLALTFYLNDMIPIFEKWSGQKATPTKRPFSDFFGGHVFEFIDAHLKRAGQPAWSNSSLGNHIDRFLTRRKSTHA